MTIPILSWLAIALSLVGLAMTVRLRSRWRRVGATVGALMVGLAGLVLRWAFPPFELASPPGPNAIGTSRLQIMDPARAETFSANPTPTGSGWS